MVVCHRDPVADGAGDGCYSRKEAQQLVDYVKYYSRY